nr:ntcA [Erythrotrichia foliiformis]
MLSTTPKAYNNWFQQLLQSQNIFEILTLREGDVIYLTDSSIVLINMHGILSTVKKYTHYKSFIFALSPPNTLLHYKTNKSICYHKVQALTNSYILVFSSENNFADNIINRKLKLMELESLKFNILYLDNLFMLFTQNTIKKKVVVFLLALANQIGHFFDTHIVTYVNLSQAYIAEALGVSRISVTRSIKDLNKQFIVIEKNKFVIFNPIALASSVLRE